MADKQVYFAARKATETASVLINRAQSFYNFLNSNAFLDKLKDQWKAYHGIYGDSFDGSHKISFSGDQGELTKLPVNHYRNLAQHMLNMITSTRPIMEARAMNTDYKSLAQTYLANGILDYYMREKKLEDYIKSATETAIVMGAGFIKMDWNATAGNMFDVDPETGEPAYEGEIEFSNIDPFNVIVDGTKESWNHDWIMVRSFKNRFDLSAKYPELEEKILGIPSKSDNMVHRTAMFSNDETDDIPIYEFFHRRSEAMPEGRYLLFLDSDVVLLDTKLPYRTIPIFRIAPSNIMGTPYGYSPMFDVFPIQEGVNSLYSAVMSNQNAFAVQNVFVPRGSGLSVTSIGGGLNVLEGDSAPQPLNLTNTPKEVFEFLDMLIKSAETISGVNSVARGNPEASLRSGTSLALVQSMALQFMSGLQSSYVRLIEDVGTSLIEILKDYASAPKTIALVGKNNRPYLKEFSGESIGSINRVVVDIGNPLSRTIAGRVQMAEQMMQMGAISRPEQYFQVINTGRLDVLYEGEMSELLLIKQENEKMLDGDNPLVAPTDKHRLHIQEHRAVLADPDMRTNPDLVKVVMDHIQEHLDSLRNTDPDLLALVGEQALPPPGMTPGMPLPPQQSGENAGSPGQVMEPATNQNAPRGEIIGGGNNPNTMLPGLPQVDASLLANPGMQEATLGNVR